MFQLKELLDDIPEFRTPADGSKQQLLTPISAHECGVIAEGKVGFVVFT